MAAVLGHGQPRSSAAIVDGIDGRLARQRQRRRARSSSPARTTASSGDRRRLLAAGARKVVPLTVAGPFHSPLMEPARAAFAEHPRGSRVLATRAIPVLQNTDPTPDDRRASVIRERLIAQITSPVRWTETMAALAADGPITLIEAGPGAVLTGLARSASRASTALAVETAGLETIVEEVS